jgi:methionyl-tRNA synthetase
MKMASQYLEGPVDTSDVREMPDVTNPIEAFEFSKALDSVWSYISDLDGLIQEGKPFQLFKTNKVMAQKQVIHLVKELERIARNIEPFMPETSKTMRDAIRGNKKPENLFARIG